MKTATIEALKNLETNIKNFLNKKGKPSNGYWLGKLNKAEQIEAFGIYLGKGRISVSGDRLDLHMIVKVCFGLDYQEVRGMNAETNEVFENDPLSRNSLI